MSPTVLALETRFCSHVADYKIYRASRRFKKINPMNVDLNLIPLQANDHWSLVNVRPQMKKIEYYDSLYYPHKGALYQCFLALRRYCVGKDTEFIPSLIQDTATTTPKQTYLINCGVYVTWYAKRLPRNLHWQHIEHSFCLSVGENT